MLTPLLIITLIVLVIEIIVGIVGNLFIAVINCTDWIKRRKLLRFLLYVRMISYIHSHYLFSLSGDKKVLTFLWKYLTTSSLWFATWLIIFYLVKTANFSQPLFLQMKLRISGMVPPAAQQGIIQRTTLWQIFICIAQISLFFLYIAESFFPLTISLVSLILLITCLWSYTKKMQQNIASFRDPKTGAHINTIKALISFLILCVSSFAAQILLLLLNKVDNSIWTFEICAVMVVAYPSVHSIILILINSKLNEALVRILQLWQMW
uniref:Taste receptor type 2 n=1 Tax=Chrysemys picta bellii TaxID=8478 RepID=A0A8C3FPL7_CHRPI